MTSSTSSASWPPPSRAATSITSGPPRLMRSARQRGPVGDPERLDRAPRDLGGRLCVRGRPDLSPRKARAPRRPAKRSRQTASSTYSPPAENPVTVTSGPSTYSSTSTALLRDPRRASLTAASSPAGRRTSDSPARPVRSDALTTTGKRKLDLARASRRPASAAAALLPRRAPRAGAGCSRRAARSPARSGAAGRSSPPPARRPRRGVRRRARSRRPSSSAEASRSIGRLVVGRDDAAPVREREAGRRRVAVADRRPEAAALAAASKPELRRPGSEDEQRTAVVGGFGSHPAHCRGRARRQASARIRRYSDSIFAEPSPAVLKRTTRSRKASTKSPQRPCGSSAARATTNTPKSSV